MGFNVDDLQCSKIQVKAGCALSNRLSVTEQHGTGNLLVNQDAASTQNGRILTLRKYNAAGFRARFLNQDPGHAGIAAQALLQAMAIVLQVEVLPGNSRLHSGRNHRRRYANHNPRIEWFWNDVVRAKAKIIQPIDFAYGFGNILLCQTGKRVGRRELHLVVDSGCTCVECAAEDSREAKNIVHLIRIVRPAGGDNSIGPCSNRIRIGNLRIRVCQGKDKGPRPHSTQHLPSYASCCRKADENIGIHQSLGKRAEWSLSQEPSFVRIEPFLAPFIENSFRITHQNVFGKRTEEDEEPRACDRTRSCAIDNNPGAADLFTCHLQSIQQCRTGNNRCAVLIIMEHRNLQSPAQLRLNDEALGCLDVLQIDSAECGLEHLASTDDILWIVGGQLKIKDVDVRETLEEDRLPLHHWLACGWTNLPQPQNSSSVRNNCYEVRLSCVFVDEIRFAVNCQTGSGHTRGVGQTQIPL